MLQFGKIAIVGAGNVAYTLCKVLKNKEIKPYCVYVRNAETAEKMRYDLDVETVSDYEKVLKSDFLIIPFFVKKTIYFSLLIRDAATICSYGKKLTKFERYCFSSI